MTDLLYEMSKPQYTGWMVLISCIIFAWIGYMGHDDDDWPGGTSET